MGALLFFLCFSLLYNCVNINSNAQSNRICRKHQYYKFSYRSHTKQCLYTKRVYKVKVLIDIEVGNEYIQIDHARIRLIRFMTINNETKVESELSHILMEYIY